MGGFHVTGVGGLDLIHIGDDSIITGPIHIDVGAPVNIGDRVHVGHHVVLLTVNHRVGAPDERCGPLTAAPVTIGDGAWIASSATILPGVSVGECSVVGAGAVVARDVEPHTMVAGVPARPVSRA
jgi:acetyltransferase-like isoleucine patch superfamily enzyme